MTDHKDNYDVGVIVGRFQLHELHGSHHALIKSVCDKHKKVIVVLGVAQTVNTTQNPLDFEARKQMILAEYPQVIVLNIKDVYSNLAWSKRLDETISDVVSPTQSVLLYGGRGSFIDAYHGKYDTKELFLENYTSATVVRNNVRKEVIASADFRAGVIWAALNRFASSIPTVDIAIFNDDWSLILLGRKEHEPLWRLPGGFADPQQSRRYEDDAAREAFEETGCKVDFIQYLASDTINDARYEGEPDQIKTLLFAGRTSDEGVAGDDLKEVRWFNYDELDRGFSALMGPNSMVMPNHRELVRIALTFGLAKHYGEHNE